jgi:hypothetical protein
MNPEEVNMWKLVMAEYRYYWVPIGLAFALIAALSVCHLLFEGATWQIISTTISTILILPVVYLAKVNDRAKRLLIAIPLPLAVKNVAVAQLMAPISVAVGGMLIPWLFVLIFNPGSITPVMVGRSLLIAGFLITISVSIALITDIKHVFREPRQNLKYRASLLGLMLLMAAMFMSVYMLQYPHIHRAVNLAEIEYHMNHYPGVLLFGTGFILVGIVFFAVELQVFQRRKTYME